MLPWLAHGHISPFIELANKLISRRPNFHVYLCSSPINLAAIRETKVIKHPSRIELVELHLPSSPDLPPQSHTTKGLPRNLIPTLLTAMDTTSSQFSDILTELSPDLLISDILQPWAPKLALSLLKIPTVCFITCAAIFHDVSLTSMDDDDQESDNEIFNWLNKKSPSSVVYISFGSECYLSRPEILELAHALLIILLEKACPISFVWVIRFPKGEEVDTTEALPEGFAAAVGEKVYVAEEWAPQRRILRHESLGGFVSHCGWSSVMEAMKYGVPIVGVPLRTDQPMNAKLVEEVGFGLKVEKIERGEMAKVIEEVVVGRRNLGFKEKGKEIRDCLLEKGDREIDEAIDSLVHLCKTFSV
ncbi:UDP-glucosyltransferase 29 [Linum perenne]